MRNARSAVERSIIAEAVRSRLGLPVMEIETPPLIDSMPPTLMTRIQALIGTAKGARAANR